jgi:hypothetical protein
MTTDRWTTVPLDSYVWIEGRPPSVGRETPRAAGLKRRVAGSAHTGYRVTRVYTHWS